MTTPTAVATTGRRRLGRRNIVAVSAVAVVAVIAVAVGSGLQTAQRNGSATLSRSPLIGRPAPPLAGLTTTGGHVSLASYRGRWVVVNFFASWGVPCQQETPELYRFAVAHPGPGEAAIVGVVYQDDDAAVHDFVRRHRVMWPLISYSGIATPNAYGVSAIPVTFLVSPDGRVAAKIVGGLGTGQLDALLNDAQHSTRAADAATPAPDSPIAAGFDKYVRPDTEALLWQPIAIRPGS